MKLSLFPDEEESDAFQEPKISSPRFVAPGPQSRPSGTKPDPSWMFWS